MVLPHQCRRGGKGKKDEDNRGRKLNNELYYQ
jgi:hypothetical protein